MAHDSAHNEPHPEVGHVVPLQLLLGVLGILLVLTFATVAVTWYDLGPLNLPVALAIATVKGALVLMYFMHLRWDRPFNGMIIIFTLALVMLFVGFCLIDSAEYNADLIPGYGSALSTP